MKTSEDQNEKFTLMFLERMSEKHLEDHETSEAICKFYQKQIVSLFKYYTTEKPITILQTAFVCGMFLRNACKAHKIICNKLDEQVLYETLIEEMKTIEGVEI